MFNVGDYIIYGNNGVCLVDKIGELGGSRKTPPRVYYTLIPCYSKGSKIFTPVDNEKVKMRPVISRDEALELIDEIDEIDYLEIVDEKKRDLEYKEALSKCDCRQLVSIIKTIRAHIQQRMNQGKKITSGDEKYCRLAEDSLYGELAISLDKDRDDIKDSISKKFDELLVQTK